MLFELVRSPTGSDVKLSPSRTALSAERPVRHFKVRGFPVELQARSDFGINAQPEGEEETVHYAIVRFETMCEVHGPTIALDIVIESGAISGLDVAVVILVTAAGEQVTVLSEGIPFPRGTLEEARRRGFKTWTAGKIIQEWYPQIPHNNWQMYMPPLFMSREVQIERAIHRGLQQLETF